MASKAKGCIDENGRTADGKKRIATKITPRHDRFVQAYCCHFNAQKAAIEAGYSKKSASSQATMILRNPKIKKKIDETLDKFANENKRLKYMLLKILEDTILFDVGDCLDSNGELDMKKVPGHLVTRFSKTHKRSTINFFSKEKAVELMGKHLNMFKEHVEISTEVPLNVVVSQEASDALTKARKALDGDEGGVDADRDE